MRTIETKVYKFDELSEAAKQKAIEWYRSFVFADGHDYDHVFDDAVIVGEILGIEIDKREWTNSHGYNGSDPKIYFSGFASQGDGASFEGSYSYSKNSVKRIKEYAPLDKELERIASALQNLQRKHFYQLRATISTSSNYYHCGTMRADVYRYDDKELVEGIEDELLQLMRDFADWIYTQLEKEYEYISSDDAIIETIVANEYEFTEEGEVA